MRIALRAIESNSPEYRARTLEVDLREGQIFTIGRSQCDLVLDGTGISRQHVRLVAQKRSLHAEDLNSRNGTYYRGKRIKSVPLREMDILQVGEHSLVVDKILLDRVPAEAPKKASAPNVAQKQASNDFPFFQANRVDFAVVLDVMVRAYGNRLSFWNAASFAQVPLERSFTVLAGVGAFNGFLQALVGMILAPAAWGLTFFISSTLFTAVFTVAGGLLAAGTYQALQRFLRASGEFADYLCFTAYAALLGIPLSLSSALFGRGVAFVVVLAFGAWLMWGFSRAFRASFVRLIFLWTAAMAGIAMVGTGILLSLLR